LFQLVPTVRGGSCNSALVSAKYASADDARTAAKKLMHEHGRVTRVMIVSVNGGSKFVEWLEKG
jgi:hypothetical protein